MTGPGAEVRLRPTRALWATLAAAALLWGLGRLTEGRWLELTAAVVVLPLVAFVLRPSAERLWIARGGDDVATVGDSSRFSLTVRNDGRRTTPALHLTDERPGWSDVTVAVAPLRPGEQVQVTAGRLAEHRGRSEGGRLVLRAGSPVGLFTAVTLLPLHDPGVVLPAPAQVPVLPATGLLAGREGGGGSAQAGGGTEVLGLRDWRSGDAAWSVAARASARHGRPVVLERERERDEPTLVVLVGWGSHDRGPAWERLVASANALCVATVRSGRALVLLGAPGPERPSAEQVRWAFAGADEAPGLDDELLRRAVRAAGRHGRVVLVIPPGAVAERVQARRALVAAGCEPWALDA